MKAGTYVLALAAPLMIAGALSAAEQGPAAGRHPGRNWIDRLETLKGLNLTDDQKAKLEEFKKEYGPKFKEARQKMDGILTADQKKARAETRKADLAAGKKGPEVRKDVQAATKLTDDQKAAMADARKALGALHKELHGKVVAILTPEQQEQLKKLHAGNRPHRPAGSGGEMLKGLNLTDDQKAKVKVVMTEYGPKIKDARQKVQALRKEVHEKVVALLTPEQKEQLKQKVQQRREHPPAGQ
jgi:Spy/CpxP family protein refolding chaperone